MTRRATPDVMGDVLTSRTTGAIEQRSVNALRPHPRNDTVYGDRSDPDLVASVRAHGVLNALLITADGVIISGHRRWDAARIAGLPTVPVVVYPGSDELAILDAMLESNRQRHKSNEQLAREAQVRLEIERERAKRRLATSGPGVYGAKPPRVNLPEAVDGERARDAVGEQIGVSGSTVEKLVKVVETADALRADGNNEAADDLLKTLNDRSAHAAYTKARRMATESRQRAGDIADDLPAAQVDELEVVEVWENPTQIGSVLICQGDSVHLHSVVGAPQGTDLVITSPPYNVGISYESYADQVSASEYFGLLRRVFTNCYEVMNDGGRICVVVPFGVNRNPWEPVAALVGQVLHDIGFTLRGQIVWDKGSSGNRTSWGSWRSPSDPSLRDTCEAILIGHKVSSKAMLPDGTLTDEGHSPWLSAELFMELAQDHWVVAPESAQRVGHPAPFPVQLAERLIRFYGWPGCRVLDPFAGSGTVGVAARLLGCHATLVELDESYCRIAARRCGSER